MIKLTITWTVAIVALLTVFPFIAISAYGLPNLSDINMFVRVKENGLLATVEWFYTVSTGRYVIIFIHGALAKITMTLGGNWWHWIVIAGPSYLIFTIFSIAVFFRTLFPKLNWALVIAVAAISLTVIILVADSRQALWPFYTIFYTIPFSLFALFISGYLVLLEKNKIKNEYIFDICAGFLILVGSHEFMVIPMGIFLIFSTLLALDFGRHGEPLSSHYPLSKIKIRARIRPVFDKRPFISTVLLLGLVLCIAAGIHVLSPASTLRAGGSLSMGVLLVALLEAAPATLDLIGLVLNPQKPYFLLMFFLVFFIAKATPVRKVMRERCRYFLLVPPVVFLAVTYVTNGLVLMVYGPGTELGVFLGRVQYMFVGFGFIALSSLAVLAAEWLRMDWLSRWAPMTAFAGIFVILITLFDNDFVHRTVTRISIGEGYEYFIKNYERSRILSKGSNRIVHVPEFEQPPFWIEGIHHGPNTERHFQNMMARAYGQKKVFFTPCASSIDPSWCHYRFNPLDGKRAEFMPPKGYSGPGMKIQEERLRREKAKKQNEK